MNDGKVYKTTMARGFEDLDKYNIEEVGLSFEGEIKINDEVSVLTDKDVPLESALETKNTYLKVMEVRELTLVEAEMARGVRGFLKRVFHEVYNGKMFCIIWELYLLYFSGRAIEQENLLMTLISIVCLIINMKPISLYKFIKKILKEPERLEELKTFLHEKNVSGYVRSVDNDKDIKMYVKFRNEG